VKQREERGLPGTPDLGGKAVKVPRIDVEHNRLLELMNIYPQWTIQS
jgi:hypothetical protein